jgi:hypothetical protein
LVAAVAIAAMAGTALAQDGALTLSGGGATVMFTPDMAAEMPQATVDTTHWEGAHTFSGPTFADVLAIVGIPGETVHAEALDGYSLDIPRARLVNDGAILAIAMDGGPLPEDRQPFWIILPETGSEEVNLELWDWYVYQLVKLTLN